MSESLQRLIAYLDSLQGRASVEDLAEQLTRSNVTCEEFDRFICFSQRTYTRKLVHNGEWYNLLVLCWGNGQRSPIHDHQGSSCAVRVLRGTLTESLFEFSPNGYIKPVLSRDFEPGQVLASEDTDLHQVSNLQSGDADLVTMHVYSPPLHVMGTYTLLDDKRGFEPMFIEFSDAAGI